MTINFKIDYQKELNSEQYAVVTQGDGASLVLAGAGSGKTRTLVYRVVYLLEQGIKPENILLVTFTNKAAKEMLKRIETIIGQETKGLWGGTFHHIGNRLLRIYGKLIDLDNNFTILDEEDSLVLIKSCLSQVGVLENKFFPKPRVIKAIISLAVNSCQSISDVVYNRFYYLKPEFLPTIENIAKIYQEQKKKSKSLDFDDLLWYWNYLLTKFPKIKQDLSEKFNYVLIDEYQDTNYLQNNIILQLVYPHGNLLAVGDDAQSIYGFRGSDIKHILQFPEIFKEAKIFSLNINYRSSPEILRLANVSINKNQNKFEKNLLSIKLAGQLPVIATLTDNYQQAEFIVQKILEFHNQAGIPLNEIAILFRSHFLSLEIEMELNKYQLPYQMRGGLKFFEQAHLKDIIAFLRILLNHQDKVAWLRLLKMQSGIGEITAKDLWLQIQTTSSLKEIITKNFKLNIKTASSWENLKSILLKLIEIKQEDLASLIKIIMENGYQEYLQSHYDNYLERLEDLNQLIIFISSYKNLEKFLSDITLAENFKGESSELSNNQESIILSTIHQAKGLEWKVVFLVGLAQGFFPHLKVYEHPEELDEERRLFYVAVTRAKDYLYLTHPLFDRGNGNILKPSQFISELPNKVYQRLNEEQFNNNEEEVIYFNDNQEIQNKRRLLDFDPNF